MSLGISLTRDAGNDAHNVQNIAVATAAVQCGTIFGQYTGAVTICSTTNCYAKFGENPTASAAGSFVIGAGVPRKFPVKPGWKVSLVRVTADGVASVEESSY